MKSSLGHGIQIQFSIFSSSVMEGLDLKLGHGLLENMFQG
jgi:hypothetical protein